MAKDDLMEHATSTVDFYELLEITFETSESDIRRAYRKTALKYHPDKLGKDFDPEKFHLLQIANDVLSDPSAKAAYDNARNARLQKQRQNELFEGKRRQMKEELEARERGGVPTGSAGMKRPREETEMEIEIRRLAEEGRRRRQMMEERRKVETAPKPLSAKPTASAPPARTEPTQAVAEEAEEEDKVAMLERRIREAQEAKAKRKAEKKARKSSVSVPTDSPAIDDARLKSLPRSQTRDTETPIKRPEFFKDVGVEEKLSATPKFSFSPKMPAAGKDEFAVTMERLKEAERHRLAEEIRRKEAETA